MRRPNGFTFLATTASLLLAVPAPAQSGESTSLDDQLRELREAQERLRSENEEMRQEIDNLRASTDDRWLTEKRADEIRALVHEVLADADTRASFQNGLMAGWHDHFFLASPDGRFKLVFQGQIQFRWVYNYSDLLVADSDHHRHGFELTRTKLTFSGHVFNPNLTYLVRTDKTRNEPGLVEGLFFLRDAWVRYQLTSDWALRIGLFKLPFTREELVSSAHQLAVERSLINESYNLGRSEGLEFAYAGEMNKWYFALSDGLADSYGDFGTVAGGFNPPNTQALLRDVEWAVTARWEHLLAGEWKQFDDFTSPPGEEFGAMLGLAGHIQQLESGDATLTRDEDRTYTATADASFEWGGASAFASFTYAYVDNGGLGQFNLWGLVIQGSVYWTPKLETFARYEYGWWDTAAADFHDLNLLTLGINYYLDGHDVKWTTDIGFGFSDIDNPWDFNIAGYRQDAFAGSTPQIVFRTQFQLLF